MKTAEEILKERGSVYGPFDEVSEVSQALEHLVIGGGKRAKFTAVQREAIKMVSSKLARLACGDPNHLDSWMDASNYLKLAHDDTLKRQQATNQPPKCFGSNPSPQDQAENDCHTCIWRQACLASNYLKLAHDDMLKTVTMHRDKHMAKPTLWKPMPPNV